MKKHTQTIFFLLALLLAPLEAAAESVPPVTGISAKQIGGDVVVEWNATPGTDIAYYRVYYANESILDNNGLYDDFEVTEGNNPLLSFPVPPNISTLYVSVIAVTTDGMESEFFVEEAEVLLGSVPQQPEEQPNIPPTDTGTQETVKLLRGSAISPEWMVIHFSAPITVDRANAQQALSIQAPDGTALPIRRITIADETISIHTLPQTRGVVYNVQFRDAFGGTNGESLDPDARSVLLTGHKDSEQPTVETGPLGTPTDLQDVSMEVQPLPNGYYTVTLRWGTDTLPTQLYGIVAYQTRDGTNFGAPSVLPPAISGVQLTNVTPGVFGIYLQTLLPNGALSPGVYRHAMLSPDAKQYGAQANIPASPTPATAPLAQLTAIEDDAETSPLREATHPAAQVRWGRVALLTGVVAATIIAAASGVLFLKRKKPNLLGHWTVEH